MGITASGLRMGMQIVVWDQIWPGKNEFQPLLLERIPIGLIVMRSSFLDLAHVLFGEPVPTFLEHALYTQAMKLIDV